MSNNAESQKVRFFPVYNEDMVEVGEVKYDPLRKEKQWTALGAGGYRIMDVDSRLRAEEEVKDEYLLRPQRQRVHSVKEVVDTIMKGRHSER